MVRVVSSELPKPVLSAISDFNLNVVTADGNALPYLGYIEGDIRIPSILNNIDVPILVVPDTEYRQSVPGIIGTNVLRHCNNTSDISDDPYNIALNAM